MGRFFSAGTAWAEERLPRTPERRLLLAVINRAVLDTGLRGCSRSSYINDRESAFHFIFGENTGFEFIAELVDIEPEWIRDRTRKYIAGRCCGTVKLRQGRLST